MYDAYIYSYHYYIVHGAMWSYMTQKWKPCMVETDSSTLNNCATTDTQPRVHLQ